MKEYLLRLMAHEAWANRTLLEALAKETRVEQRARELLGHICSTPGYWQRRVRGERIVEYDWWPKFDAAELEARIGDNELIWCDYLNSLPEPVEEQRVKLVTAKGEEFSMRAVDVLTQFYTHSFHHRGQITVLFREAGLEPIPTDYFIWIRRQENE